MSSTVVEALAVAAAASAVRLVVILLRLPQSRRREGGGYRFPRPTTGLFETPLLRSGGQEGRGRA